MIDSADEAKKPVPKSSNNIKSKTPSKDPSRPTKRNIKQEAVNVEDFFGSKPVEQTDRSICAEKKTVIQNFMLFMPVEYNRLNYCCKN